MTATDFVIGLLYLVAATLFVTGLHQMRAPSSARRGNLISAAGMTIAVISTIVVALVDDGGNLWGWGAQSSACCWVAPTASAGRAQ